ncbi:hypothetical protein Bca101_087240 [Brassica carinata]
MVSDLDALIITDTLRALTVLFSLYGFVGRPDIERIEKWVLRIAFDDEKNPYLPKSAARATVPGGPSVPCSTAKAVEWDAAWSQNLDLSGRAALGVHVAAYEEDKAEGTRPKKLQAEKTAEGIV